MHVPFTVIMHVESCAESHTQVLALGSISNIADLPHWLLQLAVAWASAASQASPGYSPCTVTVSLTSHALAPNATVEIVKNANVKRIFIVLPGKFYGRTDNGIDKITVHRRKGLRNQNYFHTNSYICEM
jgi:hypothetical protein